MKIKVQHTIYRGRPVLSLYDLDAPEEYRNYSILSIGIRKAKAIVAVQDEIKEFIKKNEDKNGKVHSDTKNV